MAERRMYSKSIVLSDDFLDMPATARCLYFTLGMLADDEGFINAPRGIMRQSGATNDDMKILIAKKYIIPFDTGVIVIRHWRLNNYIRSDRFTPTKCIEEKSQIAEKNDVYDIALHADDGIPTTCLPNAYQVPTTCLPGGIPRLGKDRLGKDSSVNNSPSESGERKKRFVPPTAEEVQAYCNERNNGISGDEFVDFYEAKGWLIGKNPMKDWKAAVRTWERNRGQKNAPAKEERKYNYETKDGQSGIVSWFDDE